MNPTAARNASANSRIAAFKTSLTSVKRSPSGASQPVKAFRARSPRSATVVRPTVTSVTVEAPQSTKVLMPRPVARNHYAGSPLLRWFDWSAQAARPRHNASGPKPQPVLKRPVAQPTATKPESVIKAVKPATQQPDLDLNELDALLAGFESVDEYKNASE